MPSIWDKTIKEPEFDTLKQNIKTDVLVIGGGITGILCAYMLKSHGINCVLVEAEKICSKVTKNTTAKITFLHGLVYDKIIRTYGEEAAQLYFKANNAALEEYKKMCKNTECDFGECDSVVYSLKDRQKIEKEVKALNKIGCPALFDTELELPFSVAGAVRVKNQAQFHPLKFAFSIAKDITIFENTRVLEIRDNIALTDKGKIQAEKIIVATHFPFINKHGGYFIKMYQHRSYVLALKNAPAIKDMYVDEDEKGLSFRPYNGLLLLGGGSHRTGKNGGGWNELSDFAHTHFLTSREVCRFATQDCMTLDAIPYIGQYSKSTPSLYVATGFNKWGITSSMTAAMILKDLVAGKENQYTKVFSPQRRSLHPHLAVNIAEALAGILTPGAPRCPHMGCALKFNKQEHSWDCSCHGSRFTPGGKLLDNPATGDKRM